MRELLVAGPVGTDLVGLGDVDEFNLITLFLVAQTALLLELLSCPYLLIPACFKEVRACEIG
jgi:hypothetical protein